MRFRTFQLIGERDAVSLADVQKIHRSGQRTFQPPGQKNLYSFETSIIDDRFFWLSCKYDDAASFVDYVINQRTGEKEVNPRSKSQIEPRKQFFACYDTKTCLLYLTDMTRKATLTAYLSDTIQKQFLIKNVYASVDEFCARVRAIRGFRFTQIDNVFGRASYIFLQIGYIFGLDLPEKVLLKVGYGDIPVHEGRCIIDRFQKKRDEFQDVVIIGVDDEGVEQTFDFSSIIKHIEIHPVKDENEQYDPVEVRELLLAELRK